MSELNNTVFVTLAILIGSFFSYLLQFFLGRSLSVSDYGVFNALLSVAAILGVPASVFGTAIIKEVSSLLGKKEIKKVSALFLQAVIWASAIGVLIFGFFYIFRESMLGALKLNNPIILLTFAFYLSLTFLWSIPYSFLQGLLKYKLFGMFVVISAALRFILPAIALQFQNNVESIFTTMAIAIITVVLVSYFFLKPNFTNSSGVSVWNELLFILKFSWPVMITNICLLAFNNNDLILVRANFNPETTGFYAGVVTLGKILLFGSSAVATVMFPRISALKSNGEPTKKMFFHFLKLQGAVVVLGLACFVMFPKLIALAFFGNKFLESVKYLPLFSIFIALYVLLNFLILFLFAVDKTTIYNFLVLIVMVQFNLISRFHASLYQVIYSNIITISLALLVCIGYVFVHLRSETVK